MRWPAAALGLCSALAGSACSCVAAGTRIRTPKGDVPVESLRVGDPIFSMDPDSGELESTTVTMIRSAERECLRLRLTRTELVCTPDHPIYAADARTYLPASAFVEGAAVVLKTADGDVRLVGVEAWAGVRRVFDIGVASSHHNYLAADVLVHNKSPSPQPQLEAQCSPQSTEVQCESPVPLCCSDDPAAVGGGLPSYYEPMETGDDDGGGEFGEPLFSGDANDRGRTGQCGTSIRRDLAPNDCASPCNPKWGWMQIDLACGEDNLCCQTRELTEADCIFDESLDAWRPMNGQDALAAAQRGDASWGSAGGTHQDPDFTQCEAWAGGRDNDDFLECASRLTVADQRGFCIEPRSLPDGANQCPTTLESYVDACEALNR